MDGVELRFHNTTIKGSFADAKVFAKSILTYAKEPEDIAITLQFYGCLALIDNYTAQLMAEIILDEVGELDYGVKNSNGKPRIVALPLQRYKTITISEYNDLSDTLDDKFTTLVNPENIVRKDLFVGNNGSTVPDWISPLLPTRRCRLVG